MAYSRIVKQIQMGRLSNIHTVLFKSKINGLLPFGPLAILQHYVTEKHGWVSFSSAYWALHLWLSVWVIPYTTGQLAFHEGPTGIIIIFTLPFWLSGIYRQEECATCSSIFHWRIILNLLLLPSCFHLYFLDNIIFAFAVGGLLNATFGNATETVASLYALNSRIVNDKGCSATTIGIHLFEYAVSALILFLKVFPSVPSLH